MEPRGIQYLRPVWELIEKCHRKFNLNDNDVDVYYKTYINNFKRALTSSEESIEQAVKNQLTPGTKQVSCQHETKFSCECQSWWITACNGVGRNSQPSVRFQEHV